MRLRVVLGQLEDAEDRDAAATTQMKPRPERHLRGFAQHHDADRDGDERIDDREAGDHQVGRTDRVRGLHEVRAEHRGEQHADDADDGQPLEGAAARDAGDIVADPVDATLARVATNP